jgi:hypothetical protein
MGSDAEEQADFTAPERKGQRRAAMTVNEAKPRAPRSGGGYGGGGGYGRGR